MPCQSDSPKSSGVPDLPASGHGYAVAVRALAEFAAREGSLDLRFTPSPSAQEGIAGHAAVAGRRGEGYEAEVRLEGRFAELQVRGRADGYDSRSNRLEEIKTVRGEPVAIPDNHRKVHWAQAMVYGWLICEARGLQEIDIAVIYYDILSQREYPTVETCSRADLQARFETLCLRFLQWAKSEMRHRSARDAALTTLAFPHGAFRHGQRLLAESVYKANISGRTLLAQAPTGIGKSIGTLFPVLKAMPGQRIDKLFFLCARSTGRGIALAAATGLRRKGSMVSKGGDEETGSKDVGVPLRVLELVARDKACEHPDAACHGESCPLARGFYDRLPGARAAACARSETITLDRDVLREIAREHAVCPYYLAQELVRWSDVIVGDYNYYFDRTAMLAALAGLNGWRVSVLVDEAHNLVERGRAMYTAHLDRDDLRAVLRQAPPQLGAPLRRVARHWDALVREQGWEGPVASPRYAAFANVPEKLRDALQQAAGAMLDYLGEIPVGGALVSPAPHDGPGLLEFCFEAQHFVQLAEQFGPHSLFDIEALTGGASQTRSSSRSSLPNTRLCVRNVVPASFLRPRLAAAHSVTLFSATLDPRAYYVDMLGLPATSAFVSVPSPFDANQLQVRIASGISTRFARRAASLPAIVRLMETQFRHREGNYLAFFSSHDYLSQAAALLAQTCPDIPMWTQSRRMDEAGQAAFLSTFRPAGKGIGFAVLGGVFAEGVDLPGDRLIGAFVATLGLPQLNPVNEEIRARMAQSFGQGYEYAYLYPGLRKVVQAAGRVIRTQDDEGVVYLIDDRFARAEVRDLLPEWWRPEPWRVVQASPAAVQRGETPASQKR